MQGWICEAGRVELVCPKKILVSFTSQHFGLGNSMRDAVCVIQFACIAGAARLLKHLFHRQQVCMCESHVFVRLQFCSVVLSSTLGDVSINAHVMSCSTGDTNAPGVCIARPDSFGGHARTRLETLSTQQDPEPRPLGQGWQLPCATDLLREKGAQQKNNNTISTIYKLHRALSTQTKRIYLTGVFPFQNN